MEGLEVTDPALPLTLKKQLEQRDERILALEIAFGGLSVTSSGGRSDIGKYDGSCSCVAYHLGSTGRYGPEPGRVFEQNPLDNSVLAGTEQNARATGP